MRGGFGIGVIHPKTESNIGTLWRSAYNLGASFIFTVGRRYKRQSSDTTKTSRHLPLFHFENFQDLRAHCPHAWIPIGIEICEESKNIREWHHPEGALYILGPEDGNLPKEYKNWCRSVVWIPSKRCLNVAVAGSIVMYDRMKDYPHREAK